MANPKTASGGGADGRYSGAKSYRAHAEKEEIVKDVDGVVGMDGWLVPRLALAEVTAVESGSADK